MDPVKGKGNGLVILLHGEPGVGKTSTAEAPAVDYRLPLYPITCGDLGDKPNVVEDQLHQTFQDARRWNCVLLLDEAHVFLTQRSMTELERNALVSVFLRTLEYYDGILFLTTHRVRVVDDAFNSRIRLSLYYPPLNKKQTRIIFGTHIDNIQSRSEKAEIDRDDIIGFAENEHNHCQMKQQDRQRAFEGWWNGRQIRNAFQTAIALASYNDKGKVIDPFHLKASHFEDVAKRTNNFDEYMKKTHGGDSEARRATEQQERVVLDRQVEYRPVAWVPPSVAGTYTRAPPTQGQTFQPQAAYRPMQNHDIDWGAELTQSGRYDDHSSFPSQPGANRSFQPSQSRSHSPMVNSFAEPKPGQATAMQELTELQSLSQQDPEIIMQALSMAQDRLK